MKEDPQIVTKIFELFYPTLSYTLSCQDDGTILYDDIIVFNAEKPSEEEMMSHLVETQTAVSADVAQQKKIEVFQTKYPIQYQLLALIKAIVSGDESELVQISDFYDSL
jgi:hypothetical protein